MEDAHVIYTKDNWAFFGVFDGHSRDQCSAYIAARRITEELEKDGPPPDDAAVTAGTEIRPRIPRLEAAQWVYRHICDCDTNHNRHIQTPGWQHRR